MHTTARSSVTVVGSQTVSHSLNFGRFAICNATIIMAYDTCNREEPLCIMTSTEHELSLVVTKHKHARLVSHPHGWVGFQTVAYSSEKIHVKLHILTLQSVVGKALQDC